MIDNKKKKECSQNKEHSKSRKATWYRWVPMPFEMIDQSGANGPCLMLIPAAGCSNVPRTCTGKRANTAHKRSGKVPR